MNKLLYLILITSTISCSGQQKQSTKDDKVKKCIQKIFAYASQEQYDSLRTIYSSDVFKTDNDLRIHFIDIRKIVNKNGVPQEKDLKSISVRPLDNLEDFVTFIPKPADSLYVDSVHFMFRKGGSYEQLLRLEVFNNAKLYDNIIIK